MFLKFIKLCSLLKLYFHLLPNDIQLELVDVLEYYKDLTIIARFERRKDEV